MARVSRKKQNIPATPADTPVRIWKTALYVRLSVEDNGKDSDSVENQTTLLEDYCDGYERRAAFRITAKHRKRLL